MNQNELIRLIQLYRQHPVLYNPKETKYRSRAAREAAWGEISRQMNITACYLKSKMKVLMGTYRSERSRERKKKIADAEAEESKWFAYKHFAFLDNKDAPVSPTKKEHQEECLVDTGQSGANVSTSILPADGTSSSQQNSIYLIPVAQDPGLRVPRQRRIAPKRKIEDQNNASESPDGALKKSKPAENFVKDSYFIYGQHIANELRKYDPGTLAYVKRAFADVLFEADVGTIVQRYHPRIAEQPLNFDESAENDGNEPSSAPYSPVQVTDYETTDASN